MRPKPRITKFIGLSTDTKPNADYGDTFLEMDTGTVYMFDGETWHAKSREREYSGDIVSFKARKVVPMQSVVVSMEPIQDLHGYDHPWPAGGGKNKLDIAKLTNYTNPGNGSTLVNNGDGTITVTATSSTNIECGKTLGEIADLVVGQSYIITADSTGSTKYVYLHGGGSTWAFGYEREITQDMLDGKVSFYASGTQSSATISNLMIRSASVSDATYAPYENLCPISGRTGADIEHTGVNVWDEEWENGYYDTSGNFVSSGNYVCSKNMVHFEDGDTLYLVAPVAMTIRLYDENKNFLGSAPSTWRNETIKPTTYQPNARYLHFFNAARDSMTTYNHDISINYPSTDTAYHAYTGDTISVTFPTEAGTVYGGTLDVVSGELVVDRAMVDMGTLNYIQYNHTVLGQYFWADVSRLGVKRSGGYEITVYPSICSAFKCVSRNASVFVNGTYCFDGDFANVTQAQFKDSAYSDAASFKSAMTGQTLVYELATPITYHLTPQEVRTLLGTNNVWSNAGDVTVKVKL